VGNHERKIGGTKVTDEGAQSRPRQPEADGVVADSGHHLFPGGA